MNRNNFLPHVALALVLVMVAAFAGQIRKWQKTDWRDRHVVLSTVKRAEPEKVETATSEPAEGPSEILVQFKPGVSSERIDQLTAHFRDEVEDKIESVPGLDVIVDDNGEDVGAMLREYRSSDEVEYAEEIFEIRADEPSPVLPNDPRFEEQWALNNTGQNG